MRKSFVYTPFYLAFYPLFLVLTLYLHNITEVAFSVVIRPVLVLLLLTIIIFLIFTWITRDSQKSALLTFGSLLSLLYYGRCYQYLKDNPVFGLNLGRHSVLGVAWLVVTIIFLVLVLRKKTKVNPNISLFLNIAMLFLLGSSVIAIFSSHTVYSPTRSSSATKKEILQQKAWISQVEQPLTATSVQTLPDIYFIIPDMFGRADIIEEETGLDSSTFVKTLENLGFYVPDCNRSNYASTQLSITSELNLQYLDQIQNGLTDRGSLVEPMNDSLLRQSLESLGYTTVVFENGFGLPEITDAELTLAPEKGFLLFRPFSPFENLIVGNSFLRVFYDVKLGFLSRLYDRLFFPYWEHVETQKYILDKLPDLQEIQGPKFIFAHIMMPHPPYLIRADGTVETDSRYYREALGQPVSKELYIEGYQMQVEYLENRLPEIVSKIIEQSEVPPIIIIQGDHGIRYTNRLDSFAAYYVPDSVREDLYPDISSVNTWRVVLNGLFGTNYPLLEDVSFYSEYPDWFKMQVEPEENQICLESEK
jgi:hypothetical protein